MGGRHFHRARAKDARPIVCGRDYEAVKGLLRSTAAISIVDGTAEHRVEALLRELVEYESCLNGSDIELGVRWAEYVSVPHLQEEESLGRRWSDNQ